MSTAANSQSGKGALHDLEPQRNPIDRLKDRVLVTRDRRRTRKVQLDLGLDTRLKEMPDPQPCVARLRGVQGRVVDVAPDRPRHLRAGPDALIGESNLATDRPLTATKTAGIDLQRDRVRAVIVEGRILAAERADQSPRNKGIKNAIRHARGIARSRSHS